MGILREPAEFIVALGLQAGFSVCELGDQWMAGLKRPQIAEAWYHDLGCGRYVSIDGNGKGTLTADLNQPMVLDPFDLVTDFGTGEHIFDQAQVWRTMHALTKPGGYLAFDRPAQGYDAHCYYRTDPCLFRDVADANNYEVMRLETGKTPRGTLIRGVFRRRPAPAQAFRIPQQGRYRSTLVIR